ncbi:hypothetical protein Tco_0863206 [Tanacetum coccineum]
MTTLKFADTHNMVAFLSKPTESDGFEQIVDFLNAHSIRHALTINPTIYISCIEQFWSTVKVKTINGEAQLHALVDGKKIIITESSVRRDLKLEDEEGMIRNLDNMSGKFLMYQRFVQVFFGNMRRVGKGFSGRVIYNAPSHTKKIFGNMRRVGKGFSGRVTPLFPTMVVQNQSELGEDEAVHKELGDSLVRATTTASTLEAEHDSGNITKTRSKATPNESSSLGTTSGGGPRCQETMEDTTARTRFESISKHSSDSLLIRVNTLRSDKDRLKPNELMKLSRVESSSDEEDLGDDASKQGRRINAIDADEDITLVNVQDDADNEMFDLNVLNGKEVFVTGQNENVVEEVVNAAQVSTTATTITITTEEITLAQALKALKTSKPKLNLMKKKDLQEKKAKKEKEANISLIEEWDDIQAKIDADHQLAERLQAQE